MIGLLQRVVRADVRISEQIVAEIRRGLLVFVGVERGDTPIQAEHLGRRIAAYRVFPDPQGRMNYSVRDIEGEILLVPQFTLAADTRTGNRPSFSPAASPDDGLRLFNCLTKWMKDQKLPIASGLFGEDMQVALVNDGPVTFWLRIPPAGEGTGSALGRGDEHG